MGTESVVHFVSEAWDGGTGTIRLLEVTAGFTLTLAVLSGVQKYLSRLIYLNKFKMIQRLRKMSSLVK